MPAIRDTILKELQTLRNIGPVMAGYLFDAGITSVAQFQKADLAAIYLHMEENARVAISRPHYRALVGAKHNLDFGEVPEALMSGFPASDDPEESEADRALRELMKLPNLGRKSAEVLIAVGVQGSQDLMQRNAHELFVELKKVYPTATRNLLKAIIGAQSGKDWREIHLKD